jgi:hypothetical protein
VSCEWIFIILISISQINLYKFLSKSVKLFQHNRLQGGQKTQILATYEQLQVRKLPNLASRGHWHGHDVILLALSGFDITSRLPHKWIFYFPFPKWFWHNVTPAAQMNLLFPIVIFCIIDRVAIWKPNAELTTQAVACSRLYGIWSFMVLFLDAILSVFQNENWWFKKRPKITFSISYESHFFHDDLLDTLKNNPGLSFIEIWCSLMEINHFLWVTMSGTVGAMVYPLAFSRSAVNETLDLLWQAWWWPCEWPDDDLVKIVSLWLRMVILLGICLKSFMYEWL